MNQLKLLYNWYLTIIKCSINTIYYMHLYTHKYFLKIYSLNTFCYKYFLNTLNAKFEY